METTQEVEYMRFTLKYRGEDLKSSNNANGRKAEKHLLRQHFHPQLKRVWTTHNILSKIRLENLQAPVLKADTFDVQRPIFGDEPFAGFLFRHKVDGSSFIPMITGPMEANVHLLLRIGRACKPGSIIFSGGDLDGRIRTLFDSLRVPKDKSEMPTSATGDAETFCLLSDDSLITGLTIESYELLEACRENYIDIDIAVTVTAVTPMMGTMGLLFG